MNFLAIVQRLHRESGRSTPALTTVATTDLRQMREVDAVKDAWREIQSSRSKSGWKWMRRTLDATLTVDQQTYDATADFSAVRFGRWRAATDDYWPIVYVDGSPNAQWSLDFDQLDTFRQKWIYRVMGGTVPIDWTVDESQRLLIGPKPGQPYKLRIDYLMGPAELAADTDVPDLPERFHNLLMWRALIDIATYDAKPEILARAQAQYDRMYGEMLLDQALELPHLP